MLWLHHLSVFWERYQKYDFTRIIVIKEIWKYLSYFSSNSIEIYFYQIVYKIWNSLYLQFYWYYANHLYNTTYLLKVSKGKISEITVCFPKNRYLKWRGSSTNVIYVCRKCIRYITILLPLLSLDEMKVGKVKAVFSLTDKNDVTLKIQKKHTW